MDMQQVLTEYDSLFGRRSLDEIETFLLEKIRQAQAEGDQRALLTLHNELLGLSRDTGKKDVAMTCIQVIEGLCKELGLTGDIYGTTLLNIANASRAFGLLSKSYDLYEQAEVLYQQALDPNDMRFASLYNNWSLLLQAEHRDGEAAQLLRQALAIVSRYPEAKIEQATTMTNLANMLMLSSAERQPNDEALTLLRQALSIFEANGGTDYHYSAALAALGNALYRNGQYEESANAFERAMHALEHHIGRSGAWQKLEANYLEAKRMAEGR